MSEIKKDKTPFWVWLVMFGTLSFAATLFIDKSDIGTSTSKSEVDAVAGTKPVSYSEQTDYSAFYSQNVTYQCGDHKSNFTAVSTQYSVAVLMVDQKDGHIYNIAAFNQKRGDCVPLSVGRRIVNNGVVNDYYNRMINRLYPNNVR